MKPAQSSITFLNEAQRLGHYVIVRKIGQGGMSVVYEAVDERLKRSVALKALHPFLAENKENRARFLREAQAIARLQHPNIVQIYDVADEKEQSPFIVCELLKGITLKDFALLYPLKRLPELSAMIVWTIAEALHHAHSFGIIHRDLKPENIMITDAGHPKLMDFGIACLGQTESITQSGVLLGSFAYLAPEIIRGEKASPQSDIYSLSVVFYWLTTGSLPFESDNPSTLIKKILDGNPPKTQNRSPFVMDEMAHIIDQGLSGKPQDRLNAKDFSIAVSEFLINVGLSINLVEISDTLKSPAANLAVKEQELLKKMSLRMNVFFEKRQEAKALALKYRIEASTKEKANFHIKSGHRKKAGIYSLLSLFFVMSSIGVWQLLNQPPSPVIINDTHTFTDILPTHEPAQVMDEMVKEDEPKDPLKSDQAARSAPKVPPYQEKIDVLVWPFATIYLNGKLIAKNAKRAVVDLPLGVHKLVFVHTYAATVEKTIKVEEGKINGPLQVTLVKSKPAFLVVHVDVDAEVAVDGNYKGTTSRSLKAPIIIPMPDKTHAVDKEILIQKDGFEPILLHKQFVAGETVTVTVKLVAI